MATRTSVERPDCRRESPKECPKGGAIPPLDHAGKKYFAPTNKVITKVEFDWQANYDNTLVLLNLDAPDRLQAWGNWAFGANSGHAVVDLPAGAPWVALGLFWSSAWTYPYATGAWYARVYNLKIYYRDTLWSKDSTWSYVTTVGGAKHVQLHQADETLDGQSRRTRYEYDSYGNTSVAYDDGDPGVSTDNRKQTMSYVTNSDVGTWIVDHLSEQVAYDASNNVTARTRYYYDRDGSGNRRALGSNPTLGDRIAVERVHLTDANKTVSTDYWYDAYGNLTKEQDGRGNQTNASYDTTYHTFPVTITNAKNQSETRQYDAAAGKPTTVTDVNAQSTQLDYDSFKRLTKVAKPGDALASPTVEYSYYCNTGQAAPRFAVTSKQKDGSGDGLLSKSWYDGMGRVAQTRAENAAASNPIVADTVFDGRGLKSGQSVPYVSASNTWDYTTRDTSQLKTEYAYECLGRPDRVTNPDGTTYKQYHYSGRATTAVDEKSHRRDLVNDVFGRLAQVKEYTGSYPGTLYATTAYVYDTLDNLVRVTDNAGNVTQLGYNSLSQKTSMSDPDMGSWSYGYDLAGNLTGQTDAKGQVIELAYDVLNRLERKYYAVAWVSDIVGGSSRPNVYDLMELRAAVDTDRFAARLPLPLPYNWTDPEIVAGRYVAVRAPHFNDLRSAIGELWSAASLGSIPQFTTAKSRATRRA